MVFFEQWKVSLPSLRYRRRSHPFGLLTVASPRVIRDLSGAMKVLVKLTMLYILEPESNGKRHADSLGLLYQCLRVPSLNFRILSSAQSHTMSMSKAEESRSSHPRLCPLLPSCFRG